MRNDHEASPVLITLDDREVGRFREQAEEVILEACAEPGHRAQGRVAVRDHGEDPLPFPRVHSGEHPASDECFGAERLGFEYLGFVLPDAWIRRLHLQREGSDPDPVVLGDQLTPDLSTRDREGPALVVEDGAVGAPEVRVDELSSPLLQPAVVAGDGVVLELKLVVGGPADGDDVTHERGFCDVVSRA